MNLFIGNRAQVSVGDTTVRLEQETRYPWEGTVEISVDPQKPLTFALLVRIPGWAREEPMPGRLYRYLWTSEQTTNLKSSRLTHAMGSPLLP